MGSAVVAAFAAAFAFALGSALQQRVAGSTSPEGESRSGFLVRIARHPSVGVYGVGALVVGVGAVLAAGAMVVAHRTTTDRRRGAVLAGASGVLFGLVAGLVKLVLARLESGLGAALGSWPLWALVVVGVWAVLLNQRAYQATRLSVTTPILNVAEVAVAIGFGLVVLGEDPGQSPAIVLGEVVGLALVIAGVVKLASANDDGPAGAGERAAVGDARAD